MDWFLYDIGLRRERFNSVKSDPEKSIVKSFGWKSSLGHLPPTLEDSVNLMSVTPFLIFFCKIIKETTPAKVFHKNNYLCGL